MSKPILILLNLVLGQSTPSPTADVKALRCTRERGLVYGMSDTDGRRIGKAIKASRITTRATLPALGRAFAENQVARLPFKAPLRQAVDKAVMECKTLDRLTKQLGT